MDSGSHPNEPRWKGTPLQPLNTTSAARLPDTYGVVVVANSRREPILVTHGVLRQEVWRVLTDPLSKSNDAAFFQICETDHEPEAERLAEEIFLDADSLVPGLIHWRFFPVVERVT